MNDGKETGSRLSAEIAALRERVAILEKSERRYRALFEANPIPIGVTSRNGALIEVNRALLQVWGCTREEAFGRNVEGFYANPEEREKYFEALDRTGKMERVFPVKRPDGSEIFSRISTIPFDFCGEPCFLTTGEDITAQLQVEEDLSLEKRRFQALIEQGGDAVVITSRERRVLFCSPSITKILGYSREEMLNLGPQDLLHPDDLEKLSEHSRRMILQGIDKETGVYRYLHQDGTYRFLEVTGVNLLNDPSVNGIAAYLRDVTARKKAEEALAQQERRFRALIEQASEAIFLVDPSRKILYASPSTTHILGYSPEEYVGKSTSEFIHPEDNLKAQSEMKHFTGQGIPFKRDIMRYRHRDGTYRMLEGRVTNLLAEPSVQAIVINTRDVTEQIYAEEALKQSEKRYRAVVDGNPLFILRADREGTITYANPALIRWMGCGPDDLIGRNVFHLLPETPALNLKSLLSTLTPQTPMVENIEEFTRPDGEKRIMRWLNYLLHDEASQFIEYLGIGEDITNKKLAERDLRRALSQKETLLRELYHRVKNNMQVIRSMLHLQLASSRDISAARLVTIIDQKIQTMALVHTKLYQSQDLSSIDLQSYIQELGKLLVQSCHKDSARIRLTFDLESVPVLIDVAVPCGLILNELFTNAIKHAFPGERGGTIHVSLKRVGDCRLSVNIRDDGVGVPPDFDFRKQSTLGLRTIFAIGEQQLLGKVRFSSGPGTSCSLEFENSPYRPGM